jgi:hypothetical protein
MQKFIHNLALLASLIVLSCGLWQDWAVWLTVQRMFISYLGFFLGGSGLSLAFRAVHLPDHKAVNTENTKAASRSGGGR